MKKLDYGKGNITKTIFAAAVPMLIAQLINLLYNLIDRVYIGRIPDIGTAALGSIGLTFPVLILIAAFTNLYSGGGAPLFAISLGQNNTKKAASIMRLCFYMELFTAIIIIIFCEIFAGDILVLFGASENSLIYSVPYLRIYLLGTVFSMLATGMNPFINAQGFPGLAMISVTTGALANLILDPVFIFVFGMGVRGAAIATVISQGLSAFFTINALKKEEMTVNLRHVSRSLREKTVSDNLNTLKNQIPIIKNIILLGLASFVMQFTNFLVQLTCNKTLAVTGGDLYISVMTIISSLRQIFETPILAVCEGAAPIISYNLGAGSVTRIKKAIKTLSIMSLAYTAVILALIMLFPHFFIAIFCNDKTILDDCVPATRIYFLAFIFMTLQYIGQTCYKALNKKKQAIFFSIFRKVIIVVPLTIILPHFFTPAVNGVFAAEPISNLIGGSASFFTMLYSVSKLEVKE